METLLSIDALKTAFDSMAEAVLVFDSDYMVVYLNAVAHDLCHISIGNSWEDIEKNLERRTPEGGLLNPTTAPVMRAMAGERVLHQEIHVHDRQTGARLIWVYNAVPVRDPDGNIVRVIANIRDITEEKRRELTLERTARALKQSNDELERFAMIVSHDLKEPLRIIGSFSQLLSHHNEHRLDDQSKRFLRYILTAVDRMNTLIHDLIELSRVAMEHDESRVPVDSNVALGMVLHDLQFRIEELGADVTFDSLPVVLGHSRLISQIFLNLLTNALKYCEVKPKIRISARLEGREWLFSITDNGIGIDPAHHKQIFELFQRLHGRNEYPGSGIGLAICKRIVERYDGRIWVESEPGKGSTFYFTLPVSGSHSEL